MASILRNSGSAVARWMFSAVGSERRWQHFASGIRSALDKGYVRFTERPNLPGPNQRCRTARSIAE